MKGEKWLETSYKWNKLHPHNPVDIEDDELRDYFTEIGVEEQNIETELENYKVRIEEDRIFY